MSLQYHDRNPGFCMYVETRAGVSLPKAAQLAATLLTARPTTLLPTVANRSPGPSFPRSFTFTPLSHARCKEPRLSVYLSSIAHGSAQSRLRSSSRDPPRPARLPSGRPLLLRGMCTAVGCWAPGLDSPHSSITSVASDTGTGAALSSSHGS